MTYLKLIPGLSPDFGLARGLGLGLGLELKLKPMTTRGFTLEYKSISYFGKSVDIQRTWLEFLDSMSLQYHLAVTT